MAYTPNPDRKVVNGKAVVSAKELSDFQSEYGKDKTLRDLLNADKGLSRAPEFGVDKPRNPNAKDGLEVYRQGATYTKEEPAPKTVKARSLVDQGRDVDIYKDVDKEAVLGTALGLASLNPAVRAVRMARPVIGAALKKEFSEDGLFPTFNREKEPPLSKYDTLSPENQAVSRQYRSSYDDRPGPMKKGGAVKQYTKGGKINLGACGVSTHVPSKKNANW
jgi:hypothetical protein